MIVTVTLNTALGVRYQARQVAWDATNQVSGVRYHAALRQPARRGTRCWSRDALVAGLVPGVLLGWSWPDRLRHAVALGASASAEDEVDLVAYERLVGEVRISHDPIA